MTYIDIHILQTVPPSNLNRDDTGSPKTAFYGAARRARVSSQAWKRATRTYFNSTLDKDGIGYRTKRLVDLVAERIVDAGFDATDAEALAKNVVSATGIKVKPPKKRAGKDTDDDANTSAQSDYLVFASAGQVSRLADLAVEASREGRDVLKSEAKAAFQQDQSIDVALFGRMVADDAELNVDAAVQVAHAISVHAVDNEFDYFTAVDDLQATDNQPGAGMIGTVEFNSSTLYRYATINIDKLIDNLGDREAAARAAATFVDAFVRSMPTGKQNTFANRTLPDVVAVVVRDDQPVNLVGAFEERIRPSVDQSMVARSAQALARFSTEVSDAYGGPRLGWVAGRPSVSGELAAFGAVVPLSELVLNVESLVATPVGEPA